jgi:Sigma-70, region 4
MSSGYVIPLDPVELASRFPAYDPRCEDEEDEGDLCEEDDISTEEFAAYFADTDDIEGRIEPLLERIPEREADLILMYFVHGKRQADIATIFGVTQAAISYRLDRGIKRIKFLLSIPQVTKEDLYRDLPHVMVWREQPDGTRMAVYPFQKKNNVGIDVDILVGMWETTCQSEVATRLKLTQGRVRHRFFKAVKILEDAAEENERFRPYHSIFSAIASKRFNILREVKLPQWADRGGDECT